MFEPNASILLIGGRGTGQSSLAFITQVSLGLQHVELDDVFLKETGVCAAQFRKQPGSKGSETMLLACLERFLTTYTKNCVIVWPKDFIEVAGLIALQHFGRTHPVILVQRDAAAVQQYLKLPDRGKLERLMQLLAKSYRVCSNYEYFNLEEIDPTKMAGQTTDSLSQPSSDVVNYRPRSLRLKRVEESFLRLVKSILHPDLPLEGGPDRTLVPQSRATYTYMLTVSVAQISSDDFDMELLNCGADAVQLDIEFDETDSQSSPAILWEQINRAFAAITRTFNGPVVYHLQPRSTELSDTAKSLHLTHLRHGFRLGVDFVALPLVLATPVLKELIKRSMNTRLIGDFHDSTPGQNGWMSQARRNILASALDLGIDGIRFTQPALSSSDNREAASFLGSANRGRNPRPFVIAYNTGPLGRTSRCFNEILTPITTDELQSHLAEYAGASSLPSEITIQQSQRALYASFVYDPMKYYTIGGDVSFSYSPVMHNAAHEFFAMPHRLHLKSMANLDELSHLTDDAHFGGLTIAQPYKRTLLSRVSNVSHHAKNIGAINTLLPIRKAWDYTKPPPPEFWANRNRAGPVLAFFGDNFDWVGMMRCIKRNLSPANVITANSTALVIGAGGMARAAIYALLNLGVRHIVLYNRTQHHARMLADHFSEVDLDMSLPHSVPNPRTGVDINSSAKRDIRVLDSLQTNWYDDLAPPTAILSCIPAPTPSADNEHQLVLPPHLMKSPTGGVVIDMDYRMLLTPLLRQVQAQAHRGWVVVDGLENLSENASAQYQVFTCRKVPKNLMCVAALRHYLRGSTEDTDVSRYMEGKLRRLQSKT